MKKPEKRKKKPGRPATHKPESFYLPAIDEAERIAFSRAAGVDGIDDEIALIRLEIRKAVKDGTDLRQLVQATNALERLIRTRYQITREQRKGLREAIGIVLQDIALPLGIKLGTDFLGK